MKELMAAGITPTTVRRAALSGLIEQIARGAYRLAEEGLSHEVNLAGALVRVPRGLICLGSAAHYHGLLDEAPSRVCVAIHNRENTPKVDSPPIRFVRWTNPKALTLGVETRTIAGVAVRITSPPRTVVDLVRMADDPAEATCMAAFGRFLRRGRATDDVLEIARQLRVQSGVLLALRVGLALEVDQ